MKISFVKPEVKAGKRYRGEITRYATDEEYKVLRVYVVLDREPQIEFMKRFEGCQNIDSPFARFCYDMGIYMDDDSVELDELKGLRVKVKLKEGNDKRLYVNEIQLDEKFYETQYEEG